MALHDDEDSLGAAAAAALAAAINAAKRIKNDDGLAARIAELEGLPSWRGSPNKWLEILARTRIRHRAESAKDFEAKSLAEKAFNRVCWNVEVAGNSGNPIETRHRELLSAGIFCGLLFRETVAESAIADAVEAAFIQTGSQGGKKGNAARNKIKADAFVYLSSTFPETPTHVKGAAKGKPDAPKIAAALQKNPATSHLPEKTRRDWAKEWAKTR